MQIIGFVYKYRACISKEAIFFEKVLLEVFQFMFTLLSIPEVFTNPSKPKHPNKTKSLCFGSKKCPSYKLMLNESDMEWVSKWKYLGDTLLPGQKFGCCVEILPSG